MRWNRPLPPLRYHASRPPTIAVESEQRRAVRHRWPPLARLLRALAVRAKRTNDRKLIGALLQVLDEIPITPTGTSP